MLAIVAFVMTSIWRQGLATIRLWVSSSLDRTNLRDFSSRLCVALIFICQYAFIGRSARPHRFFLLLHRRFSRRNVFVEDDLAKGVVSSVALYELALIRLKSFVPGGAGGVMYRE